MEFIRSFSEKENHYSDKIKTSSFIEGNLVTPTVTETSYSSILEIFIQQYDIEYSVLETNQVSQFVKDTLLTIASDINMDGINLKILSETMVQKGLLETNKLSSILYLNHHFKTNCIIKNKQTGRHYKSGVRDYPPFICIYDSGKWYLDSSPMSTDIQFHPISDLQTFISMDVSTNQIYQVPLKALHNYKVAELETLATEMKIELRTLDDKKKRKKELYDELNLKYIQQPT